MKKTLIDDFGTLRLNRKWYASTGSHLIHRTGGEMVRRETITIYSEYDPEQDIWWQGCVWRDSPESGPRMEYAY